MKYLRPFGTQSFAIGVGLAAITYLFGPTIRKGAKGVAVKGVQGAMVAGESATNMVEDSKEKATNFLGNIMKSPRNKNHEIHQQTSSMYKEMLEEIKAQRDDNSKMMQEMLSTIKNMQNDIVNIKNENKTDTKSTNNKTTNKTK